MKCTRGFTLVNMMLSLGISSMLVSGAVMGIRRHGESAREDQLRRDLLVVRTAVQQFKGDTGLWPQSLTDLSATTAPTLGINRLNATVALDSRLWRGPYLRQIPTDPISRGAFGYAAGPSGYVSSSATGADSRGVAYSSY